MKSKKIKFDNSQGFQLSARIDEPDLGKPVASVRFAHCFTCGKNLKAAGNISRSLTNRGIAVFRFDFTG